MVNESGAFSAWDKVLAIQDYLINGNNTTEFLLNHDGSGRIDGLESDSDIAHWILNSTQEGSCDEFTTVFAVMLRLAGLSTRKVTGFAGGTWTGDSWVNAATSSSSGTPLGW